MPPLQGLFAQRKTWPRVFLAQRKTWPRVFLVFFVRRIFLKRFPFNVIFRDVEGVVQILAIAHKRRRPDYWLSRL